MEESKKLPRFEELIGRELLEKGVLDPTHVMAVIRLGEETRKRLEDLEKFEVDTGTKSRTNVSLTELATTLRVKYRYTLDVELVGQALYHLVRGLNLYPCQVVAHYWPEPAPVVFLLGEQGVALVVAPRLEDSFLEV